MAWSKLGLLTMCMFLGPVGCVVETLDNFFPVPELPVKLHAQDIWSNIPKQSTDGTTLMSEREAIFSCIGEWNEMIAPRLKEGKPLPLVFDGFRDDPDFSLDSDLVDNVQMIYRVPEMTPEIHDIFEAGGYPEVVVGYGLPRSDVLVIIGEFVDYAYSARRPEGFIMLLRDTVCHELGHVLGLQHRFVFPGIMNEENKPSYRVDEFEHFVLEADADSFCFVHSDSCK